VAWVREAAGDRLESLELHVNAGVIGIDADAWTALDAAATRTGQTVDQLRQSPGTLVGSVEAIVDKLQAQREQFGVSYYVVQSRYLDAFAPVVARLR